jgi:hypothetical protein
MESDVFSCDYNGWADVPEDEREGIEAFEAASLSVPATVLDVSLTFRQSRLSPHEAPVRWAA